MQKCESEDKNMETSFIRRSCEWVKNKIVTKCSSMDFCSLTEKLAQIHISSLETFLGVAVNLNKKIGFYSFQFQKKIN
jgi:hypothetical protein